MLCFQSGIIKKINEITALCGIGVCGIIYEENNTQAVVCPSEEEVQMVLDKFMSFPEFEQRKLMVDHEGFLRKSIAKALEKLKKQKDNSKKNEMNDLIGQFIHTGELDGNVGKSDLEDLLLLIVENLKDVEQRIEWIQAEDVM